MSSYTNQNAIQGRIAAPHLVQALDDTNSGQLNTILLAQIIADVSNDIDAQLGGIYGYPLPQVPVVTSAALVFACEKIYQRRLATDETNIFHSEAKMWREELQAISKREKNLDASIPAAFPPGVVQLIPMAFNQSLT